MQGKYTKSKKTDQDIKHLTKRSIADFGEHQTDKYLSGLEQCLQLLAENPNLGRTCDELRQGYRRHEYGSHIIFYRKRKNDIFITTIIHQSRDIILNFQKPKN